MRPVIDVAAGCLINPRGEVLICQRPAGKIAAGKWEFPGGKIEPGESARDALARELMEELGIRVVDARPLIRVTHAYSDRTVVLDTWHVSRFDGTLQPRENQAIVWSRPDDLACRDLLAADRPIVTALRLPSDYVFSPPDSSAPALQEGLNRLPSGSLLRLRCPQLDDRPYEKLAQGLLTQCRQRNLQLILDRSPQMARALGAAGWHATTEALRTLKQRPVPESLWFGASCHDRQEIELAAKLGADFAVAGPVQVTASHPGAQPLGWDLFSQLATAFSRPLYAIGGVGPEQQTHAWRSGAQGTAGISAYWSLGSGVVSGGVSSSTGTR